MDQFPSLNTERLVLNELRSEDVSLIALYASNKNVSQYTVNIPFPYEEKDAVHWLNAANQGFRNRNHYIFAIRLKSDHLFGGGIGLTIDPRNLRAEMGYWIAEPLWNNGLMTEAVKAVLKFGFTTLGLHKIVATHLSINESSGNVMIKCGMAKEGVLKDPIYKHGVFHDLVSYGLVRN